MLRGPVPRSEQWPKVDRTRQQDPRGRSFRNQGQRKELPAARIPRNPDEVIANAHSRVGKLESAISVLDENDPTVLALKEALRQARSQTQVRPVEERIDSTKLFIERAEKRVLSFQEEVAKAQAVLREAEAKVLTEEDSLREGESRLAALQLEAQRVQERIPPPTAPADFAQELAELRVCAAELQRERDELRSELDSRVGEGQEIRQRRTRSLAPSLDLVMGDPPSGAGQ